MWHFKKETFFPSKIPKRIMDTTHPHRNDSHYTGPCHQLPLFCKSKPLSRFSCLTYWPNLSLCWRANQLKQSHPVLQELAWACLEKISTHCSQCWFCDRFNSLTGSCTALLRQFYCSSRAKCNYICPACKLLSLLLLLQHFNDWTEHVIVSIVTAEATWDEYYLLNLKNVRNLRSIHCDNLCWGAVSFSPSESTADLSGALRNYSGALREPSQTVPLCKTAPKAPVTKW